MYAIRSYYEGPFSVQQLSAMAAQGQINSGTLVWKQGMAAWTAASAVQDLSVIFQTGASDVSYNFV